jgi:hypothetical protein
MSATLDFAAEGAAIRADIETARKLIDDASARYARAGDRLIAVKQQLSHGKFHAFLVEHKIGHSSANLCMRIAAGKTTIEEVRADVAERVSRHRQGEKRKARQNAVTNGNLQAPGEQRVDPAQPETAVTVTAPHMAPAEQTSADHLTALEDEFNARWRRMSAEHRADYVGFVLKNSRVKLTAAA